MSLCTCGHTCPDFGPCECIHAPTCAVIRPTETIGKLTREQTQQKLADVVQDVDELILKGDIPDLGRQALVRSADHLLVASRKVATNAGK